MSATTARRAGWLCAAGLVLLGGTGWPADTSGRTPEEYGEEEFSPALKALRRGEIVMLGSLPFSLFFTLEAYDLYRFFSHYDSQEGFDPAYSPWPFRRPGAAPYTRQESIGVFVSALGVSLLIAVTDYLIGRIRERRAARPAGPD